MSRYDSVRSAADVPYKPAGPGHVLTARADCCGKALSTIAGCKRRNGLLICPTCAAPKHDAHVRLYRRFVLPLRAFDFPERHDAHVQARRALLQQWIDANTSKQGRCVLWIGPCDTTGRPKGHVLGTRVKVRHVVLRDLKGRRIAGREVAPTCGNPACLSHLKAMTRSERIKGLYKHGIYGSPKHVASLTAATRSRFSGSMEKAREARRMKAENSALTTAQIAQALGMTEGAMRFVLQGKTWRESDAVVPMVSVFALGALAGTEA